MDNRQQLESSIRNHERILGMRSSDYRGASLEELRRDESGYRELIVNSSQVRQIDYPEDDKFKSKEMEIEERWAKGKHDR